MKIWKRNAIVATVLVLICAGVYLNWSAANKPVELTETLDAEQVMSQTVIDLETEPAEAVSAGADGFAQIRLSRQQARDSAVELLQTAAYEDGSDASAAASASLDHLVSDALAEAQIESLIIAKGYTDCVAYMAEDGISVAVAAPETGLLETDVALISDIVTTQTDYTLGEIQIIEVK